MSYQDGICWFVLASLTNVIVEHAETNNSAFVALDTKEVEMPSKEVMHKWKTGKLHSGSKTGPKVKNRKQAIAIMLSEKRAEKKGKLK